MSDEPTEAPSRLRRLLSPRSLKAAIAAGVVGAALGWAGGTFLYKNEIEAARRRFETFKTLTELYDLQMKHHARAGAFANSLDALLAGAPDGAAVKRRMGGFLDLSTLAVVGDEDGFKLEANVLDGERTFLRLRGPVDNTPPEEEEFEPLPLPVPAAPGEGAPIQGR